MTHVSCPGCRLRFTPAASAYLKACPTCGQPPEPAPRAELTMGFRLVTDGELRVDGVAVDAAVAVAVPAPGTPGRGQPA